MAMPSDERVSSKVELSISCSNLKDLDRLSKSDPVVFLFEKRAQQWVVLARTEVIDDNLNPKFATTIIVDYRFEEIQNLKFACYDADNKKEVDNISKQELIGEVECSMAEIVTAGQKYERKLRHKGKPRGDICIKAEEVADAKFQVTLQLSANGLDKKDFFGKSDPYFEISKVQEGGAFTIVHRSQPIMKTLNPRWPSFTISAQKLCSGDWDRTLRFSVWDWDSDGSHDFIGDTTTTLRDIVPERGGKTTDLELINSDIKKKKRKYTNSGTLLFSSVTVQPVHSFMDYVKGGCQISLIAAIDFTASNGTPSSPNSLHYIDPYRDNEYVTAIKSVGSVLTPYDSDNQFPVFGFGAKFHHNNEVSHCFPLNFNPEHPEVIGVQGILDSYYYALNQVSLYGPTNFSSILDTTIKYASFGLSQTNQQYYILLIITDGEITDMLRTIERIVSASSLPLSIVIVGVGDADFSKMETLDADDTPLVDKYGKKMDRDIVQFVPFRKFQSKSGANFSLARETLAEIPNQFITLMKKKGIVPNPPPLRRQQPTTYMGGAQQGAPYPPGPPGQGPTPYPTGPPGQGPAPYPTGPQAQGPSPYPTGPPGQGPAPYPTGPQAQAPYP